ncbi:hypothetical protein ACLB2K_010788 [Fragaria x ananassa]
MISNTRSSPGQHGEFLVFGHTCEWCEHRNDRQDGWYHGRWTAKMHLHSQAFCSFCSTPLGNDSGLNVFFIVMTMVLAFGFAVIGSLLPASVISIYGAFMCYTALSSEPRGYACNGLRHSSAVYVSTSSWDGDDHSFSSVLCITCSIFNNFSVTTVVTQGSRKETSS